MDNLYIAKDSGLHDYKVINIFVDYIKMQICLCFETPQSNKYEINIKFLLFKVTNEAKWGQGTYVVYSDIICDKLNIYTLQIQLNSGDTITVKYKD